jgi:hypothetical protein
VMPQVHIRGQALAQLLHPSSSRIGRWAQW